MLMIRSWKRWVCTTHPRLTVDAVARGSRGRLRAASSCRTTHPGRSSRRGCAATRRSAGVPAAAWANQGAGDHLDERVGDFGAPDEATTRADARRRGCAPPGATCPTVLAAGGDRAGGEHDDAAQQHGHERPHALDERRQREQHAETDRAGDEDGDDAAQLPQRPGEPEVGRAERRCGSRRPRRPAGAAGRAVSRATTSRPSTCGGRRRARPPGRREARGGRPRPSRSCRGTRACRSRPGAIRSQPPPSS